MCRSSGTVQKVPDRVVLPTNVRPSLYKLVLEPNFDPGRFVFDGTVSIDLDVVEPTKSISLNMLEIEIHSSVVRNGTDVIVQDPKFDLDEKEQTITFHLGTEIAAGEKINLSIDFTGDLNDKMSGFYRSTYTDQDGQEQVLATTQMEPTDARRAFPCFDEPAIKAEFEVTLVADSALTCLSNMDIKSEAQVPSKFDKSVEKKAVTFNRTPLMSTYLLAFIVGKLNYIETNDFHVPIRVYAPPNVTIEAGRMSLDLAAKTLDFYERQFDSKFPLPKMDMVAIPDFSAAAMENWGLITYRTTELMVEPNASALNVQRVTETVQHELAHQWFGNLVTMEFWDGLWLNEGFATWMSWFACNHFHPDWKMWESFSAGDYQEALYMDSYRSSHPVEVPISRAEDVNEIFDSISYSKGSCVLRMIAAYLGEEVFLAGVRRYISRHKYGNTVTSDLWTALAEESGKPVEEIMGVWTKNVGFPVVRVTEPYRDAITVSQSRFLATNDVKTADDLVRYPVMLSVLTKDGVKDLSLVDKESTFKIDTSFYKVNSNSVGFYRTLYPDDRLDMLSTETSRERMTVEDRVGLVADVGVFASSGQIKSTVMLSFFDQFSNESSTFVWRPIMSHLGGLKKTFLFQNEQVRDNLQWYCRSLSDQKIGELGWEFPEGEDHVLRQFKAQLFDFAGASDNPKVLAACRDMFSRYIAGDFDAIHPNIKASVFNLVMSNGGEAEFEALLKEYRTERRTHRDRTLALRALGYSATPELISRALALTLSSEVKTQDIYMPIIGIPSTPVGADMLWDWMTDHFDELETKIPAGLALLGSIVERCTTAFSTQSREGDVRMFFSKRKDRAGYNQSFLQALNTIQSRTARLDRDRVPVSHWLHERRKRDDGEYAAKQSA